MVKRVYGKANNFDVTFERQEDGKWRTAIPSNLDGEVAVELYAEDMAGNLSFMCKALFVIVGHALQITLMDRGYRGEMNSCKEETVEKEPKYQMQLIEEGYTIEHSLCCRITD